MTHGPTHTCRESWQRTAVRAILRGDAAALATELELRAHEEIADAVSSGEPEDSRQCRAMAGREVAALAEALCLDDLVDEDAPGVHRDMDALREWVSGVVESCGERIADDVTEYLGDSRAYAMNLCGYYGVSARDFF